MQQEDQTLQNTLQEKETMIIVEPLVEKDSILIVGKPELIDYQNEMNPQKARLGIVFQEYFSNQICQQIDNRETPMKTYGVYHDYSENGFTLLVGEKVSKIENLKEGLSSYILPKQHYLIFKAGPGLASDIARNTWCKIATTKYTELGLKRTFKDFKIYDERANDPNNMEYEIFIGVEKM